jgi:hypothetical protein
MSDSSAAASAQTGIQNNGGNAIANQPNLVAWAIVGAVLLVGILAWMKHKT